MRAEVKAGRRRIALVGPTAADARNVMVEGASGILAISPDPERPLYEPSKRRLTWPNGAIATTYSAPQRVLPKPRPGISSHICQHFLVLQASPANFVISGNLTSSAGGRP